MLCLNNASFILKNNKQFLSWVQIHSWPSFKSPPCLYFQARSNLKEAQEPPTILENALRHDRTQNEGMGCSGYRTVRSHPKPLPCLILPIFVPNPPQNDFHPIFWSIDLSCCSMFRRIYGPSHPKIPPPIYHPMMLLGRLLNLMLKWGARI